MELGSTIAGMMEVELTSADPEEALSSAMEAGMDIVRVRKKNMLTVTFLISRSKFPLLARLSEKRGDSLKIRRRFGSYWVLRGLLGRPVLLIGFAFLLCMVLSLPTRVFFVTVEGNHKIPSKRILAAAEASGIRFGSLRREVRSEKVKNLLLSEIPELQWAGVNTSGCTAVISVRERSEAMAEENTYPVTSIVAERDGFILSGTVTSGSARFQVGQTVEAGQVLVSGYTDCDGFVQATRSQAEIFAQTRRECRAILPAMWSHRGEQKKITRVYAIRIGKKRINLWKDSGNPMASCGRMYSEYYAALPGGFRLPVALCVETFTEYEISDSTLSQEDAEQVLGMLTEDYLQSLMVAGEIRERFVQVHSDEGVYRLDGEYICREMIGRVKREQIGETNGEDS